MKVKVDKVLILLITFVICYRYRCGIDIASIFSMLNNLITQTCEEYKLEYGRLEDNWTKWNFESYYDENSLIDRLRYLYKNLEYGIVLKVYGKDICSQTWSKVIHCPILKVLRKC